METDDAPADKAKAETAQEGAPAEEEKKDEAPKEESPKKKRKKRTAKDYMIGFLIKVGVTVLAVWVLLRFVAGVFVCHTNSSYPMIKDGDLCLTYKLGEIKQGDVVAYKSGGSIKFGRVIALAGDSVEIKDDYIAVNGYGIFEETVYPTHSEGSKISYPYTVPENSVFVLNDYRSDVSDSRTQGAVSLGDCRGKVFFIMRRRGI